MPSATVLEQKKQAVANLSERLKNACAGVLVDYKGINVADDTKLRRELREAGITYEVIKNTLLRLAATEAGLDGLHDVLEGTTALASSETDYVAAARILVKYTNTNKNFKIKAGFVDGGVVDETSVVALSKLPLREELVARALGGLNAPISGFVGVLHANLRSLVIALNAIAEKQSA